jgi:signal transduction histidine kinase
VRLHRLIEQMVMYVQWQSGALADAIRGRVRSIPLHELIQSAIHRTSQFSLNRGTSSVYYEPVGGHILIQGDIDALRHALAELIANARMFSDPEDDVIITGQAQGERAQVIIVNRGYSLPQEELKRVFEPYYQFNRRRFEQQGIGLGLPLARGITEIHGGTVNLESGEDFGTRAVVVLPTCNEC